MIQGIAVRIGTWAVEAQMIGGVLLFTLWLWSIVFDKLTRHLKFNACFIDFMWHNYAKRWWGNKKVEDEP